MGGWTYMDQPPHQLYYHMVFPEITPPHPSSPIEDQMQKKILNVCDNLDKLLFLVPIISFVTVSM